MKKLGRLCVIFVLSAISFGITDSASASPGLKVYVSLFNDGGQLVTICVFTVEQSAGCKTYGPEEYNLHQLGPFTFSPSAVPVGQAFTACASIKAGSEVCNDGINGVEKEPERVTISLTSGQGQPTNPQGEQLPDGVKANALACFIENSNIPIISEEWKFLDSMRGIVRDCP